MYLRVFLAIVLTGIEFGAYGENHEKKSVSAHDCSEVGLLTVMFKHLEQRTKKLEAALENQSKTIT